MSVARYRPRSSRAAAARLEGIAVLAEHDDPVVVAGDPGQPGAWSTGPPATPGGCAPPPRSPGSRRPGSAAQPAMSISTAPPAISRNASCGGTRRRRRRASSRISSSPGRPGPPGELVARHLRQRRRVGVHADRHRRGGRVAHVMDVARPEGPGPAAPTGLARIWPVVRAPTTRRSTSVPQTTANAPADPPWSWKPVAWPGSQLITQTSWLSSRWIRSYQRPAGLSRTRVSQSAGWPPGGAPRPPVTCPEVPARRYRGGSRPGHRAHVARSSPSIRLAAGQPAGTR